SAGQAGTDSADSQAKAEAAGLEKVDDFGSNPGALNMYRYTPEGLPAGSPVVVVLHGCTQDAATYFEGAGWKSFADAGGFSVVAAQQEQGNNINKCFNWFQSGDTDRGKGEALSVKQMVDRTVADLDADTSRVFVTGLSAGGAMTSSMLAAYPDVFKAGAVIAGIPHGCATTVAEAFSCMSPGASKSAAEWGDLVRKAAPDHSGARPAVSVWHGTADTTVVPSNADESVKQWTNVHDTDQEADATEELPGGTARSDYKNGNGDVVVRSYSVPDMPHGTPVKPGEGCGKAGKNFLDTICSSKHITADWGLGG
ncbi:MAG TPA: PHB depolymerase family esterase, partial [Streptomyces sp.]|nr:PHB depolymerase family esterase [Streptomyces sp.]